MKKARIFWIVLFLFILGCNEEEEINKWIEATHQLKIKVEENIVHIPYRDEEHQTFKNYFSQIAEISLNLEQDKKFIEPFNTIVSKNDLNKLCPKIFLSKDHWQILMKRCTKNRFFLCSEEVRAYPDLVKALREYLNEKERKRFEETSACQPF